MPNRKNVLAPVLIALASLLAVPGAASADTGCDRYASPAGSDVNPGTEALPVRSIAHLIEITGAGEDGCLPAGSTFVEPIGTFIVDDAGGEPGNPAVIRSADPTGEPAIVKGALWLKSGVHDLTFERIRFTDSPGNNDRGTMLVIDGDRVTFSYTEITFRRGICLNAGHRSGYETGDPPGTIEAEGLVIEYSRIHDCGNDPAIIESLRDPEQSGVHGIYLVNAPGAWIHDNYIYDTVDRGLQFWPDVDGALVEHNVFDGNGSNINVGSSAEYGHFSEDNRFVDNIVTNAGLRSAYDEPWGPGDTESIVGNFPAGSTRGNVFTGNCLFQPDPTLIYGGYGYTHDGDVFADPLYVDRAAADFRLQDGSPCAGKGPRGGLLTLPPEDGTPPPVCEVGGGPPRLRFLRSPARRRGGGGLLLSVRADAAVKATVKLSWAARSGALRVSRQVVELAAGLNRLRLRDGRPRRGAPWYRIELVPFDCGGGGRHLQLLVRRH